MPDDADLTRALHAIAATLRDQKLDSFDADRVQQIATGATAGEPKLIAYGSGTSGELRDGSIDGPPLARFTYDRGEWSVERVPESRESEELQRFEERRAKQKETEFQKPVRGRLAIWKQKLTGG